jgi:hypothetical protein
MFLTHHTMNLLAHVIGTASFLMAAQQVSPPPHRLPNTAAEKGSNYIVNRALKADKLMVSCCRPQANEPVAIPVPRPRPYPPTSITIGCEPPFSAMVSIKTDLGGRCLASAAQLYFESV